MAVTRQTQRKFKSICYYVLSWIISTLSWTALRMYGFNSSFDVGQLLFMLQFSLFIGISHGVYDIVILKDEMDCRPVWKSLLVRSLYFFTAINANTVLCILLYNISNSEGLIGESSLRRLIEYYSHSDFQVQLIEYFVIGYLITFIRSVHKKFGARVFWNTLLGKSQEPIEEDLIFMFIDLKDSTTIAEELGHVTYSNFMKDYYKLLSNCCEENQGEIYQIAGDGVFLTWHVKACRNTARPILCFYDFAECMQNSRRKFIHRYGIAPSFKAGAHCGKVISTEVGNFGSEMAYHGDVLNTTSRIQSLCSKLGQEFLISEDLYKALPKPLPHGYSSKKEGYFELKGKKNEILVFSLQTPLTIPEQ